MSNRQRKTVGDASSQRKKNNKEGEVSNSSTESSENRQSVIPYRRIFIRLLITTCMVIGVYLSVDQEDFEVFAKSSDVIDSKRVMKVKCSDNYKLDRQLFPECVPKKCGRVVSDGVISENEAKVLLQTAKSGMSHGTSNGGATILDLHSGALTKGDKFVNVYKLLEGKTENAFSQKEFQIYRNVKNKIHKTIAEHFQVPKDKLYLTSPTFFSQMTTKKAKTVHDEYWHVHIDKETYGSFHYTSLLYLNDYGRDFQGGRFVFVEESKNVTVEPRLGRLSFFTSGEENPHFVEKLTDGVRYAITVSFTCDPSKAIEDPKLPS